MDDACILDPVLLFNIKHDLLHMMHTPAALQTFVIREALRATLERDVWEHFSTTGFLS